MMNEEMIAKENDSNIYKKVCFLYPFNDILIIGCHLFNVTSGHL